MKYLKPLAMAAFLIAFVSPAHASGRVNEFDCGNQVTVDVTVWKAKFFLDVFENDKHIVDWKKFYDAGLDNIGVHYRPRLPSAKLNAGLTSFEFHIKLNGKTVIAQYHHEEQEEFVFGGHPCKSLGDPRYEGDQK
jgi:hypothetical protein